MILISWPKSFRPYLEWYMRKWDHGGSRHMIAMRRPETVKILKAVVFVLILAFYASVSLYQIKLPVADDLARHIKNGEMILRGNFDVLYKNVYSYTEPDQPFTNHHWLSGVIFYLLFELIGFD